MDTENTIVLNTKKTMDNFLEEVRNKVNLNSYPTKEALLEEINNFKMAINNFPKTEEIHLQNFDREILNILQTYDEKSKNIPKEDHSNYKEFERENGQMGATIKIGGEMHTITKQLGDDKTVFEEMKDMYNKEAVKNLDAPVDVPKDTIENNFELLRKYTHEEANMTKSKGKVFSIPKKALQYYSIKNRIQMEFASDGMARDKDGVMYEAVVSMTGEVTIYKTRTTTYKGDTPHTEEKIDLETISINELVEFEKTKPQEEQTINFAFLAYLKEHLEDFGYREILKNNNLSKEEINMYEDLLKEDVEQKRKEELMKQNYTPETAPKVLVLEKDDKKRNGFVDALLLSIITSLFGGLCLTYFLMGILFI